MALTVSEIDGFASLIEGYLWNVDIEMKVYIDNVLYDPAHPTAVGDGVRAVKIVLKNLCNNKTFERTFNLSKNSGSVIFGGYGP